MLITVSGFDSWLLMGGGAVMCAAYVVSVVTLAKEREYSGQLEDAIEGVLERHPEEAAELQPVLRRDKRD